MMNEDDSVKLREELDYEDFYPLLKEKTSIQAYLYDNHEATNHKSDSPILKKQKTVPVRHIRYNNEVRVEEMRDLPCVNMQRWTLQSVPKNEEHYTYSEMIDIVEKHYSLAGHAEFDFKCSYDMDTQDYFYFKYLKELNLPVTENLVELVMLIIELEWHRFENYIPQKISDLFKQSYLPQWYIDQYGCDDGRMASDDTIDKQCCSICDLSESVAENSIIFCDGCNIAVHQECYGVVFIPEGPWFCRKCLLTGSSNTSIACKFCPSTTGAFKQTASGGWAHVLCGLWIPELSFANINYMEPITNEENIPKSRWRLNCFICGKKNYGCCIQCINKNCFTAYHPTCAKRSGLFLNLKSHASIKEAASGQIQPNNYLETYCPKHQPTNWVNCESSIQKTKDYFKREKQIKKTLEEEKHENMSHNSILQLKTKNGTPVCAPYFVDKISAILKLFVQKKDLDNIDVLSFLLCKYWTMKKEACNGVSLLKNWRPHNYDTKNFSEGELDEQLTFMKSTLLPDLNKLLELSELLKKKHDLQSKLQQLTNEITTTYKNLSNGHYKKDLLVETLKKNAFWKRLLIIKDLSEYFNTFVSDDSANDFEFFEMHCATIFAETLQNDDYSDLFRTINKFGKNWKSFVKDLLYDEELDTIMTL